MFPHVVQKSQDLCTLPDKIRPTTSDNCWIGKDCTINRLINDLPPDCKPQISIDLNTWLQAAKPDCKLLQNV